MTLARLKTCSDLLQFSDFLLQDGDVLTQLAGYDPARPRRPQAQYLLHALTDQPTFGNRLVASCLVMLPLRAAD